MRWGQLAFVENDPGRYDPQFWVVGPDVLDKVWPPPVEESLRPVFFGAHLPGGYPGAR